MILFFCFLPLIAIFILMKFVLLVEESHKELTYVKEEPNRTRGPFLENVYDDIEGEDEDY